MCTLKSIRAVVFGISTFVAIHFLISLPGTSQAQGRSTYSSEADQLVTIRSLSLLPVFDNLRGIYSRPVESHLIDQLKKSHRWEYSEANTSGPIRSPEELEESPAELQSLATGIKADAFVSTSVVKGPAGITIKMSLFLKSDQKLLAQESLIGSKQLDVEAVKRNSADLINKLLKKIPYTGLVLSRQGNRVTVNLGRRDGLVADQVLTVIQIIKLNRHPKFNFLVSTEKEVIGKVRILKVDETLSFGRIVSEKESGAIQLHAKLTGMDDVVYSNVDSYTEGEDGVTALQDRPEGKITFGENPISWLPQRKPTFGSVGARIGIGRFAENVKTTDTLDASAPIYPSVSLEGEVWLTPVWSIHANIRQGVITTDNPVSGASPSELSRSLSAYDFLFGYNMRLGASITAPKVEALFGFATYRLFTDQSNPPGLTTKTYSGPKFGVSGSYPIGGASPYSLGANLHFLFNSKLKESGGAAGSGPSNSVNNFGFFVDKAMGVNLKARFALDFELYSSDFSGGNSASQKHTVGSAGLHYLF